MWQNKAIEHWLEREGAQRARDFKGTFFMLPNFFLEIAFVRPQTFEQNFAPQSEVGKAGLG